MNVIHTILIASCLKVNPKDTVKPVFTMYSINAQTKVPPNYYATKTGFFCATERAIQKQTQIQVKLRLGSLEHTQKLEGYNLSTLPSSH